MSHKYSHFYLRRKAVTGSDAKYFSKLHRGVVLRALREILDELATQGFSALKIWYQACSRNGAQF
jgi:hypothetical protein